MITAMDRQTSMTAQLSCCQNRHAILIRIRESGTEFTIQGTMSCTPSGKVDLHMQTALKPVVAQWKISGEYRYLQEI